VQGFLKGIRTVRRHAFGYVYKIMHLSVKYNDNPEWSTFRPPFAPDSIWTIYSGRRRERTKRLPIGNSATVEAAF
jgi:hypothetical protein